MGWDVSPPHRGHDFLLLFLFFQSFESHVKNFYFSLCALENTGTDICLAGMLFNSVEESWSKHINLDLGNSASLYVWHLQICWVSESLQIYSFLTLTENLLNPMHNEKEQQQNPHFKPSKEKKIVLIANFEIIPWKRSCCILSSLLPFYSLG